MLLYLIWFTATVYVVSHEMREWIYLALQFKQDSEANEEPMPDSVKHMYS